MNIEPRSEADIRAAELVWPRISDRQYSEQQEEYLVNLVDLSKSGLILDCSLVEVANSEVINLLMHVRHSARNGNKSLVLFNVPGPLNDIIRICKLETILPCVDDAMQAKALIHDMVADKGRP